MNTHKVESLERQESLYKVGDRVVLLGGGNRRGGRPKGVVVGAEPDNGDGHYTVGIKAFGGMINLRFSETT